jgi:histone deacetylase complex regulatory component SIN3
LIPKKQERFRTFSTSSPHSHHSSTGSTGNHKGGQRMKSRDEMDSKSFFKSVKEQEKADEYEKFLLIVKQLNKGLIGMQAAFMYLRPVIGDTLLSKFKKVVNY